MTLWILVMALWLSDGQILHAAIAFDTQDECEAEKPRQLEVARLQFNYAGSDALCVPLTAVRSQQSKD
jgi:hypothetical protein